MTPFLDETVDGGAAPTYIDERARSTSSSRAGFLRVGEVFGPWRLVEHIADGGFGTVWRAAAVRDVTTDRRRVGVGENAAVKFFAATTDAHRDRISREVSLARRLGGHWTPEFFGADLEAIPQWAAFELVTDATLRDLVTRTGPLSAHSLEVFAEDLWDALAFFRQHGIAHRDLTPANIHVHAATAKPRVIDWGNARDGGGTTATGALPRTPGYAAPEQVEGQPADVAADLWSWGAVVCFAATGHPPLPTDRYHHTIVTCDTPLDLAGIPESLLPALDAALRWDPADRDPDSIAVHLPGRRAHLELEAARAREADLDVALDDLRRRMLLRDERIEELDAQILGHEREREQISAVVERLRAAERERDAAAREVTSLRAQVAELERERDHLEIRAEVASDATAALRRATIDSLRTRISHERLRWSCRRLEHRVAALRARRGQIPTPWPLRTAVGLTLATVLAALVQASWESHLLVAPFLGLAALGCVLTRRITTSSRRPRDQLRAGAGAALVVLPFLAPFLFSAGAVPVASLARWVVEAPFVTPPPPDSLGVGHGARFVDVDPGDCVVELPERSFWDVLVTQC